MNKVFYIFPILIVAHFNSLSQNSVNDYKYIVVPSQFEFLKEKDQYEINSLTKFLFNKYGYTAYLQDEDLPSDLYYNRCLGLVADVVKENAFLKTKLRIDLKDCDGKVIMSSQVGETREKEYAKAYNLALREAFETFQNMAYAYQPNEAILYRATPHASVNDGTKEQEEIARLKNEIKSLKEDKTETTAIGKPMEKVNVAEETMNENKPNKETQLIKVSENPTSEVLYAQAIDNGFQVVDSTPKVVMVLFATAAKDVFLVKDQNAIVFKKENLWIYSENDGKGVKERILNIKF
ncbi:MAG: hypothetical protein R2783_08945 [Gelidibacter sp.]